MSAVIDKNTKSALAAVAPLAAVVLLAAGAASLCAQTAKGVISGPVGPSPYTVVRSWHQPFSAPGLAFGGNSGVFAESPDRIFIAQRGETRCPTRCPPVSPTLPAPLESTFSPTSSTAS